MLSEEKKELLKRSSQKQRIPYNKWYMKPTERFSKVQTILNKSLSGKGRKKDEKDYVHDLLLIKNKKKIVEVKG